MRRVAGAFIDVTGEAWWELKRARLRTYLALLGIVIGAIGLTVLICTLHLENALRGEQDITTIDIRMPSLEDYSSTIFPRKPRLKRYELTPADGEAIQQECPYVEQVAISGSVYPVDFKGKQWHRTGLASTNITRPDLFSGRLVWGRLFTPAEVASGARVVVLDQGMRSKLWPRGYTSPGSFRPGSPYIHINGVRFEIIGVMMRDLSRLGTAAVMVSAFNAMIPYTSMQDLFWNASWHLSAIPKQGFRKAAAKEIDQILFGRIGDPGYTYVILPGISYEELKTYKFFGIVSFLVLLAAGAAVSNKAYIDALERVQQFAVRRALGATKQRIYAIVLMESALICGFGSFYGGIIGWMVFASHSAWKWIAADIRTPGVWVSYAIPALPLGAMVLFAITLGVVGSLLGAAVAAQANPAEALSRKDVV